MPSSGVCGDGHEEDTGIKTSDGSKRNTLSAIKAATGPSSGNPTMRRGRRRRCGCYPPLVHPSHDTLRSEAKPTRMIPRLKPTSQIAKGPICEIHFGVRKFFAFSGTTKTDVVPYAVRKSHASPAGACIIASPWCWVARKGLRTAFFFTQSAATRFTAYISPSLNHVFLKKALEGLEPYTAKALRTVLRGLGLSNGVQPLGPFLSGDCRWTARVCSSCSRRGTWKLVCF